MPSVEAALSYIARNPLYDEEKPYHIMLAVDDPANNDPTIPLSNLQWEEHTVAIRDLRNDSDLRIESCGFEAYQHTFSLALPETFNELTTDVMNDYKQETAAFLKEKFGALHVTCFDFRAREGKPFSRAVMNLVDPLLVEGPAKGAHNDFTSVSGPNVLRTRVPPGIAEQYPISQYRYRIINTWRSLNPICEKSPLAVCDARTIDTDDLVPADRVVPNLVGEVYYLKHNPRQQWYWLEHQTPTETLTLVMYDTQPGLSHARYCPHVAFTNPRAPEEAPNRRSVETRSVVISDYVAS